MELVDLATKKQIIKQTKNDTLGFERPTVQLSMPFSNQGKIMHHSREIDYILSVNGAPHQIWPDTGNYKQNSKDQKGQIRLKFYKKQRQNCLTWSITRGKNRNICPNTLIQNLQEGQYWRESTLSELWCRGMQAKQWWPELHPCMRWHWSHYLPLRRTPCRIHLFVISVELKQELLAEDYGLNVSEILTKTLAGIINNHVRNIRPNKIHIGNSSSCCCCCGSWVPLCHCKHTYIIETLPDMQINFNKIPSPSLPLTASPWPIQS